MLNDRWAGAHIGWRGSAAGAIVGGLVGLLTAFAFVSTASADYTPGIIYPGVGPSGSLWEDHSTKLDQNGVDAWSNSSIAPLLGRERRKEAFC